VEIFDRFNPGVVREFDSIFSGKGKTLRLKQVSLTSARSLSGQGMTYDTGFVILKKIIWTYKVK
jgi:hypothetical protein